MKKFIFACALVALTSSALHAQDSHAQQDASEQQMLSRSTYLLQQSEDRRQANYFNGLHRSGDEASLNSLANLTKLRGKLAEAWQAIGLSPAAARMVALAYRPQFSPNSRHASLQGKTDEEIAALIQSSLASKDYQLANQTLIDLQRKRMNLGADVEPDGKR